MTEPQARPRAGEPHEAIVRLACGPLRLSAEARITTAGLLATGVLVSGILLSAATIVFAATRHLSSRR